MSSDDLSKLVKTDVISTMTTVPNIDYAHKIKLPTDYMAYIRSDSVVSRTLPNVVTNEKIGNVEMDYSKLDSIITTHNNKPILEAPIVTMDGKFDDVNEEASILIITDKYTTLKGFYLSYLKIPNKIDIEGSDCELAEYMHEDLVKLAASMYIEEYKLKLAGGGKQNA